MSDFEKKFLNLLNEKKTCLCIGLDPALPKQRSENVIPLKYLGSGSENEARLNYCLDIIEETRDYCIAAKPNQQYIFGFTKQEHQSLTRKIRDSQMLSILDYKLNDIGQSVESAMFHLAECGYDAITFNPLPGNLEETVKIAHGSVRKSRGFELGIIVLTLMSNPEAEKYMKTARIGSNSLFQTIAKDVNEYEADGCVVSASGYVTEDDIKNVRKIVGEEKVFLTPGIGTQGGDLGKIIRAGGRNLLINIGREIIYSPNPRKRAEEYCTAINRIRAQ